MDNMMNGQNGAPDEFELMAQAFERVSEINRRFYGQIQLLQGKCEEYETEKEKFNEKFSNGLVELNKHLGNLEGIESTIEQEINAEKTELVRRRGELDKREAEITRKNKEAEEKLETVDAAYKEAMKFRKQNDELIEAGKRVQGLEEKIGQLEQDLRTARSEKEDAEQKLREAQEQLEIARKAKSIAQPEEQLSNNNTQTNVSGNGETKIKLPHGLTNNQKREITSEFNRVGNMYEARINELQSKLAAANQGNQGQITQGTEVKDDTKVMDDTEVKEDLGGPINPDAVTENGDE